MGRTKGNAMNIGNNAYKGTPQTDLKDYCKKKRLKINKSVETDSNGISISFLFMPNEKSIYKKPLYYQEYFSFDDNEPESEIYKRVLRYLERQEKRYNI
jgi:hypothetical protein